MSYKILLITFVMAAALAPLPLQATTQIQLKSIHVTLPATGRMFPKGPGVNVVNGNCLACHSADMVLNQPDMPRAAWEAEVNKMRNAFKAPVDAKDVDTIVNYLASIKGAK